MWAGWDACWAVLHLQLSMGRFVQLLPLQFLGQRHQLLDFLEFVQRHAVGCSEQLERLLALLAPHLLLVSRRRSGWRLLSRLL